ncbi:MAG: type II secretion system F family protein [Spirochaetes bacterium]|nr:type II secretion system F family protein [Spirochaetota bacterium]
MKLYSAKVVNFDGKKEVITEEAISKQLFEESLSNRGFYIINVQEANIKKNIFVSNSINKKFLFDFSYNVYSLLEFGIDINEVFRILSDIYTKGKEAEFIQDIVSYLKKGEKLSMAIKNSKGGEVFDDFFITMVSSGEHSGNLTDAFRLIYTYLKNNQKIKDKLVSASIYPIVLMFITLFTVNLLFFFIVPTIQKLYKSMDFTSPLLINIMFGISDFLTNNFYVYIFFILSLIIGVFIFFRTKISKKFVRFIFHKIPVISKIKELQAKIKVSFSLEILLKGGSSLEDALLKMSEIEVDDFVKKDYLKSLSILKEGGSVRNSFSNLKIYNTRDLNIIDIADSISKSQEGLEKIHNDAEDVLESYLEKMFKLIEPVIMIFIGLLIFSIMYLIIPTILGMIDKITEQ